MGEAVDKLKFAIMSGLDYGVIDRFWLVGVFEEWQREGPAEEEVRGSMAAFTFTSDEFDQEALANTLQEVDSWDNSSPDDDHPGEDGLLARGYYGP